MEKNSVKLTKVITNNLDLNYHWQFERPKSLLNPHNNSLTLV